MVILSIETSCDETSVSILDARGNILRPKFKILGNALYSQAKIHEKYGGVYPNLAKREHQKNLIPLTKVALKEAGMFLKSPKIQKISKEAEVLLEREVILQEQFFKFILEIKKPKIDLIAVTAGPGLEPTLWVGINFAKALGKSWNIPVMPVNHMEGHFLSVLLQTKNSIKYPALALLISGGHTELVHAKKPRSYKIIGKTKDDAIGEAYDKVARMLGLPYPGGPHVSRLADKARSLKLKDKNYLLPRPMINSKDFNFSFSGLKTAVLYSTRNRKLSKKDKMLVASEFENAVTEVLIKKTETAIVMTKPNTLIVAGGVIANTHIRKKFTDLVSHYKNLKLLTPQKELATDNSIMIGIAGYLAIKNGVRVENGDKITAMGTLSL